MPTSTPDFLQYCRDAHANALRIVRDGTPNEQVMFLDVVREHQFDPDRQAEAVECYERAQRDFAALVEALEEACDWLDEDLAHAPDTSVSMADRELMAHWRGVLAGLSEPPGVEVGE